MRELLAQLNAAIGSGRRVACCRLVETRGSTPQKPGAAMLVFDDGSQAGTLGGGCVEAEVKRQALAVLGQGAASVVRFQLDDDYGWDDGLICGGRMQVLIDPLGEATERDYYTRLHELTQQGGGCDRSDRLRCRSQRARCRCDVSVRCRREAGRTGCAVRPIATQLLRSYKRDCNHWPRAPAVRAAWRGVFAAVAELPAGDRRRRTRRAGRGRVGRRVGFRRLGRRRPAGVRQPTSAFPPPNDASPARCPRCCRNWRSRPTRIA